ncbi:MAG TPA: homocysteine S-methyltransferase family protein [Thermoanaerobaculia bacterium]|nr:homocysteine S-methyltransferase family protein [Thermoanaerobaculia bacterium]
MANSIQDQVRFRERLRSGPPLLLDSAMGTELERRGVSTGLPLWSARALLEAPDVVRAIHRDDVAAGADILTANTFRTHRRTLAREGMGERAAELTRTAVALAREAARDAGRPVFVAGSLSPLEDCYSPNLVAENEALEREHHAQAAALSSAGVDAILVETHNTVRELVAAVRAARATGLPVIASMVTDGQGHLLSGEQFEEAARALEPLRPDVVSINCVPAGRLARDLHRLAAAAPGVSLAAYGNLGPPTGEGGTIFAFDIAPAKYAEFACEWLSVGARIIGGCCGTTSAHTAALKSLLNSLDS